ncbi:MAG: ketopantoate reductase family protein [Pseudomonadota bacterium]
MRFVIYGAGGIGGTIGARLFQQGFEVVLLARGEHGEVMRRRGMRFVTPEGETTLQIPVAGHPREVAWRDDDVVLLGMKTQHTVAALEDLLAQSPGDVALVCAQNGVANERMALRRFARVYAMLVHLPAMHLEPGEVVTDATGRGGILDTGCYPTGVDETCAAVTAALETAGFSARPDPTVMRFKYAKLLENLNNAVQVITGEVPREVSRLLKHEALACYRAAGIDCAGVEEVRARHEGTYRLAEVPGRPRQGGSSWQSLARGTGNIETDYLNGEIVLLGRLHGVPTPANAVCQTLARRVASEGLAPGHFTADTLLRRIHEGA